MLKFSNMGLLVGTTLDLKESAARCNSETIFLRSVFKLFTIAETLATTTLGPAVLTM